MANLTSTSRRLDITVLKGDTLRWFNKVAQGELPENPTQNDIDSLVATPVDGVPIVCVIQPNGCKDEAPFDAIELSTDNGLITTDINEVGTFRLKLPASLSDTFDFDTASYKITVKFPDDTLITSYGRMDIVDVEDSL